SAVLRDIGNIINKNLRDIDVSGRYGGEEFVAYLREIRKDVAFKVAERIRKRIEKHEFKHEGYLLHITISIGISQFPDDGRNYKELLKNADKALYIAKEKGRNRVVLFNS
ncbi:MAG: GGDEF domain-containing protein, partial [Deltaproteobacteria bacterium]|nr:GGDEF domain-containing protein [Deltaproteobacteria bacterium]